MKRSALIVVTRLCCQTYTLAAVGQLIFTAPRPGVVSNVCKRYILLYIFFWGVCSLLRNKKERY
jgi:hypothetical protein